VQSVRVIALPSLCDLSGDHLTTLLNGHRHRLFTQHSTPARAALIVYSACMEFGRANVDRTTRELVELLVGEGVLNPIPASQFATLGAVPADDRHKLGVAARVCECGNHRHLVQCVQGPRRPYRIARCIASPVVLQVRMPRERDALQRIREPRDETVEKPAVTMHLAEYGEPGMRTAFSA